MPAEQRDRPVLVEIMARLDGLNRIVQDMLMFSRPRPLRHEPVERLRQQREEIEEARQTLGDDFHILHGIELEIKLDGTLDFPDDVLAWAEGQTRIQALNPASGAYRGNRDVRRRLRHAAHLRV
jgi:hypothetical protein